jgi:prepilin peptidase CpaA
VLIVAFRLFCCGWVGGGDAKFAAATAPWFGFARLSDCLLYAWIFGGVLTLLLVWSSAGSLIKRFGAANAQS